MFQWTNMSAGRLLVVDYINTNTLCFIYQVTNRFV